VPRCWAVIAVLCLLLSGCASTPSAEALAANDPFEATNRDVFRLNQKLDRYFVVPTVGVYIYVVPEWGRTRVHDLLDNLSLPITFANDILQGETKRGGQTLARFTVNATVGLGGLFDPATSFHIPNHGEDFGETLAIWGLDEGPYLVLPLFGPSNPRDTTGLVADYFIDPLHWLHYKQHLWWDVTHEYFTLLDLRSRTYKTVQGIERSSVDFYSSTRSFYRQFRNNAIRNGRPPETTLPEF
jgi:phospholipid-binding lipoprotein MlaA